MLSTMSSTKNHLRRLPVHWCNRDIEVIRKKCLRARRLHQRAIRGPRHEELTASYEQTRKELKVSMTAKRKCWQDFCEELDRDPWGRPYKTVMNKIKSRGTSTPSCSTFIGRVVQHLFLEHGERTAGTGLMENTSARREIWACCSTTTSHTARSWI